MNRINATEAHKITDADIATKISDLGIPYVDMGESWQEKREITKDGTIIDTVTRSGRQPRSESWKIEVTPEQSIQYSYDKAHADFEKSSKGLKKSTITI